MTNWNQIIADIFAQDESLRIESPINPEAFERFESITELLLERDGIDVGTLYCAATGFPIGELADSELSALVEMLDWTQSDDELLEELRVRCLSSMRPSPMWNLIKCNDEATMMRLAEKQPLRLTCYLLCRYYADAYKAANPKFTTFSDVLAQNHSRIRVANALLSSDAAHKDYSGYLAVLLEIDSQFGLDKSKLGSLPADPNQIDISDLIPATDALEDSLIALYDEREKNRKAAMRQRRAFEEQRGNPAVNKTSFIQTLKESKRRGGSARRVKHTMANREARDMLKGLLGTDFMTPPASPKPTIKPLQGFRPIKLATKES